MKKGCMIKKVIFYTILFSLLLTGCKNTTTKTTEMKSTSSDKKVESTAAQTTDDMMIETKYGTLYYPGQWKEFAKIKQKENEEEDSIYITFKGKINDTSYPLFTITIGKSDDAMAGEITDEKGVKRNVFVELHQVGDDSLAADEQNRLYAMQEDVNYIIENLK